MAEAQLELTPEEEARIKWESLLLGKTQAVVELTPVIEEPSEEIPDALETVDVPEDSPEAVLARLYMGMIKD